MINAINACARYSSEPRQAHSNAVKKIGRCLLGALDDGLIIDPQGPMSLNLWADADFTGNHVKADADDLSSVCSRTGFVVTFGTVPVLCMAKARQRVQGSTQKYIENSY